MTTLYRVRAAGLLRRKCILQRFDDNAELWRDVKYSPEIGLFTAVRIRYWQEVEKRLAGLEKRRQQRIAKKQRDFEASQFKETRLR